MPQKLPRSPQELPKLPAWYRRYLRDFAFCLFLLMFLSSYARYGGQAGSPNRPNIDFYFLEIELCLASRFLLFSKISFKT